jgi:hypothetical protein
MFNKKQIRRYNQLVKKAWPVSILEDITVPCPFCNEDELRLHARNDEQSKCYAQCSVCKKTIDVNKEIR